MLIAETSQIRRIACMEVRGGNALGTYAAELPGLAGWVSCQPMRPSGRGGDVYYMSSCSQGAVARVVLADVSGHGEAVDSAAIRLRDALRRHVEQWDQSELIRDLNDDFFTRAERAQYATAFLASYSSESGEMLFTNAGHPPPLWYRGTTGAWSYLLESTLSREIVDLPLGLIAGTPYSQTAVQLEPGDQIVLYTDGIIEACDEFGEQLGMDRLLCMVAHLPIGSANNTGKSLLAAMAQFSGGVAASDDQTVIVLERRTEAHG